MNRVIYNTEDVFFGSPEHEVGGAYLFITGYEILKRLNKIQKKLNEQQQIFNETFLDKEIDVLFTNLGKKNNQFVGRTPFLQPVHVFSSSDLVGKILKIKIERLTSFSFHGKILSS